MKVFILSFLILCSSIYVFPENAKKTVKIKINKEVKINNRKFNIFQVIDNRLIQCQNLGYIEGLSGHKTYLFLDECLNKTLYDFLNVAFPKNDTMVAVIMKINNINCRNKQSLFHVSAIVNIEIEYFTNDNKLLFKSVITKECKRIWLSPKTYSNLIRSIIFDSIYGLNETL